MMHVSVTVNGPGVTSRARYGLQGHTKTTSGKTYTCQLWFQFKHDSSAERAHSLTRSLARSLARSLEGSLWNYTVTETKHKNGLNSKKKFRIMFSYIKPEKNKIKNKNKNTLATQYTEI
jgi:hypothetical protein